MQSIRPIPTQGKTNVPGQNDIQKSLSSISSFSDKLNDLSKMNVKGLVPDMELSQLRKGFPQGDGPQLLPVTNNPLGRPGGDTESPIRSFIHAVDAKSKIAGGNVAGLMAGEEVSLGETMVSIQESKIAFQLMVEVRNKLLEAYQELMRMQV